MRLELIFTVLETVVLPVKLFPYVATEGGVEPPFSVFQTGTPTVYVTNPYKILDAI